MATTSIAEYEKALNSLAEAFEAYNDPQNLKLQKMLRDSCIQRFEFCVELAWKVSIKKWFYGSTRSMVEVYPK